MTMRGPGQSLAPLSIPPPSTMTSLSWGENTNSHGVTLGTKAGIYSPAADRLLRVTTSLNGMQQTVRTEVDQRKAAEESRLGEVRDLASKVDKHLGLEVKRRTEADRGIQQVFEGRLKEIAERIEAAYAAKLDDMKLSIDVLTKKVVSLEKELVSERERTARLASELRHASTNSVADVKAALEQEKATRLERETQILKKIAEDTRQTQDKVEQERTERAAAVTTVREELSKELRYSDNVNEKFRAKTLDELDALKAAIRVEAQVRESGEENLAHSLSVVVSEFKGTVALLSK
eukprot:GGOE01065298.1.p1 GENE.GGOE01065298.1~~GGOE01065298.1.p1  ORF type:complete len:292 (+),score=121.65 GGOE01065298.1:104-979(+)